VALHDLVAFDLALAVRAPLLELNAGLALETAII
jgi:hypothetical protein